MKRETATGAIPHVPRDVTELLRAIARGREKCRNSTISDQRKCDDLPQFLISAAKLFANGRKCFHKIRGRGT